MSRNDAIRTVVRQLWPERRIGPVVFLQRMARVAARIVARRFGKEVADIILYGSVAKQRG